MGGWEKQSLYLTDSTCLRRQKIDTKQRGEIWEEGDQGVYPMNLVCCQWGQSQALEAKWVKKKDD
jgi:hypothetical protein